MVSVKLGLGPSPLTLSLNYYSDLQFDRHPNNYRAPGVPGGVLVLPDPVWCTSMSAAVDVGRIATDMLLHSL